MRKPFLIFENHFSIIGLLKTPFELFNNLISCVNEFYTENFVEQFGIIKSAEGPYFSFDQYNVFLLFGSKDLARGNRFFYAIIDSINDSYPGSITDYHKIIGFEWDKKDSQKNSNENYVPLGYLSCKFSYPVVRSKDLPLINTFLVKNILKFIDEEKLKLQFKIYGTFSWFEVVIIVFGLNYADLSILKSFLDKLDVFSKVVACRLLDITRKSPIFPKNATIASQIYLKNLKLGENVEINITDKAIQKYRLFESLNHFLFFSKLEEDTKLDYPNLKIFPDDSLDTIVNYLYLPKEKKPSNDPANIENKRTDVFFNIPSESNTKNSNFRESFKKAFLRIEQRSISYRKLLALRTQLNILVQEKHSTFFLHENLLKSIDFLIANIDILSDETVQYYISEYGAAIKERLAGSQLGHFTGTYSSFFDKSAGYQRLMLSCESLVLKCYFMYLERILKLNTTFTERPVIFILFDYGARLSTKIPSEVVNIGLRKNLPIILRLPMLKYKPWLWLTALRDLARFLYFIVEGIPPLDILTEDPKIDRFSDHFLYHFLTEENFLNLLKEELGFFEKIGHDEYRIKMNREKDIIKRFHAIDLLEDYLKDEFLNKDDMDFYKQELKDGKLIFDLKPDEFLNFVNAYYSLDRFDQRRTKPFTSFTLTLFWNHRSLVEKQNVT